MEEYKKLVSVGSDRVFEITYTRADRKDRASMDKENERLGLVKVEFDLRNGERGFLWRRK